MSNQIDVYINMHLWANDLQPKDYHILDTIKAAGWDGIEFFLGSPKRDDYKKLGDYCEEIGLKRFTVVGAPDEYNAVSPDSTIRQNAKDWIKERIDDAAIAGSTNLGGPYHCAFNHFTGVPVTELEIERCAEFLLEAGEHAKQYNMTLTPEYLNRYETYFGNTMESLNNLLNKVNHPNVTGMFDTYHANIEEKSQTKAIQDIAPNLSHVHISENDRGTPGSGHIDFEEVFTALGNVKFNGSIAVEAFNRQNQDFANAVKVWRNFSPTEDILHNGLKLVREGIAKHLS